MTIADDSEGALVPPRRVTLGNILSMVVTVCSAAIVAGVVYGTTNQRLAALESAQTALSASIAALPSTYASREDFLRLQNETDGIVSDRKQAQQALQTQLASLLDKQSTTNASIAGLTATVEALRDNVADIKDALKEKPLPR